MASATVGALISGKSGRNFGGFTDKVVGATEITVPRFKVVVGAALLQQ